MLTYANIADLRNAIQSAVTKMEGLQKIRTAAFAQIENDMSRMRKWKDEQLVPLKEAPEIRALWAQVQLAWDALTEAKSAWRDPLALLRANAVPPIPTGYQSGDDVARAQYAQTRWLAVLQETSLLASDPAALQRALDDAVTSLDWQRIYAAVLGRTDSYGHTMDPGPFNNKFHGTPLAALPFPEVDAVEQAFFDAETAKLKGEWIMWDVNSGVLNVGVPNILAKGVLDLQSREAIAARDFKRRTEAMQRARVAPTAVERWELLKDWY